MFVCLFLYAFITNSKTNIHELSQGPGRTEHVTDTWAFNPRAIHERSLERGVDEDGETPPDFSNRGKPLPEGQREEIGLLEPSGSEAVEEGQLIGSAVREDNVAPAKMVASSRQRGA